MGISRNKVKHHRRGEISKVLKVSDQRMKVFEREGLFQFTDKTKRYVDHENFERLRVAVDLQRDLGVNLEGVDVILAMREKMKRMKDQINGFLGSVRRELRGKLLKDLSRLERELQVRGRSRL